MLFITRRSSEPHWDLHCEKGSEQKEESSLWQGGGGFRGGGETAACVTSHLCHSSWFTLKHWFGCSCFKQWKQLSHCWLFLWMCKMCFVLTAVPGAGSCCCPIPGALSHRTVTPLSRVCSLLPTVCKYVAVELKSAFEETGRTKEVIDTKYGFLDGKGSAVKYTQS